MEIQRKRKEQQQQQRHQQQMGTPDLSAQKKKKRSGGEDAMTKVKQAKIGDPDDDGENDDVEAFEEGAADLVAKGEAKEMYCLPEGTLQVCKVVEKGNPRHKSWTKMNLYHRSELRRRARKRY